MSADRILLVRLSALGDILQCLPALATLRASRPGAEIGFAVERRFAEVLEGHPHLDRLFVFERTKGAGWLSSLRALRSLRHELRAWRPQEAIDLQGNLKGALIARLSGARRRISLPPAESRESAHWLATDRVPPASEPREHRSRRALRLVGANTGEDAGGEPPRVPTATRDAVRRALEQMELAGQRFALLLPGTSEFGAFKRWPAQRFGDLAVQFRDLGGISSLVGYGPGQEELAEQVVAASDGAAQIAPETDGLAALAALLSEALVVVGADSGPVLLAAAAGTPTVALFGPKDPQIYGPLGDHVEVVWKKVYCSPCTLRRCGDPICMTTMEVDEVVEGVRRVLRRVEASA